jgi:hypothetical protein
MTSDYHVRRQFTFFRPSLIMPPREVAVADAVCIHPNGGWGEFKIHGSAEADLIQRSYRLAELNPEKPGHHWFRVVVELKNDDSVQKGVKLFHVDLNSWRLEVTETWNGAETARLSMTLPRTYS